MIGVPLALDDQVLFVVADPQIIDAVLVRVLRVVGEEINHFIAVTIEVDWLVTWTHEPFPADGFQPLRRQGNLGENGRQANCLVERKNCEKHYNGFGWQHGYSF